MVLGRHLTNEHRWRGQRFGLDTRREEGASPQRAATDEQRSSRLKDRPFFKLSFLFLLIHSPCLLFSTPLWAFVRWLLHQFAGTYPTPDKSNNAAVSPCKYASRTAPATD